MVEPLVKSPRLKHWGMLLLFSTIFLRSMLKKYPVSERETAEIYSITIASFTVVLASLEIIFMKWNECTGTRNFLLGRVELSFSTFLIIFWSIAIAILDTKNVTVTSEGQVADANMYYFSWASFFTSVLLFFCNSCNFYERPECVYGSARYHIWINIMTSNLILMSSTVPPKDCDDYCKRLYYGCGLGACVAFVAIIFVGLYHRMTEANTYLQLELILSILILIAYGCGVFYITGLGPGTKIGNVYYSTWIGLILSISLVFDCLNHIDWVKAKQYLRLRQDEPQAVLEENNAKGV